MNSYQSRQLTVILCILTAAFLYAITKLYRAQAAKNSSADPAPAAVYEIRGDVMQEGFYCFTQEQRTSVLLQAAGGLTGRNFLPDDGGDSAIIKSGKRIVFKTGTQHDYRWETSEMDAAARLLFFMPVDINTATVEELMLIPAIGNKTAGAIVEYRRTHKKIKALNELGSLPGMGERKIQALLPYISTEQ
jgi:competence protein ComEA